MCWMRARRKKCTPQLGWLARRGRTWDAESLLRWAIMADVDSQAFVSKEAERG